jgi:hypothetical protein
LPKITQNFEQAIQARRGRTGRNLNGRLRVKRATNAGIAMHQIPPSRGVKMTGASYEDRHLPLIWLGLLLGSLYLLGTILWTGPEFATGYESPAPRLVQILARGLVNLSEVHFWIAAVLIGVGSTLGTATVLQSLRASFLGVLLLGLFVVGALQWDFLGRQLPAVGDNEFQRTGVFVALVFSTPAYLALVAKPLLLGILSAALLIHLALSLVNSDHEGWLVFSSDVESGGNRGLEMGASALILLLVVSFASGGAIRSFFDPPTPEDIIAELQPPLHGQLLINRASGRESIRRDVEDIRQEIKTTAKNPCDRRLRSWLRAQIETYFLGIRMIEDWKPGQPLSSYSRSAVKAAEESLAKGYVIWDELEPYIQIHLDEGLAQRSRDAREALNCS